MTYFRRRRWLTLLATIALIAALAIGGYGMYLGSVAGRLPWQEDPTRIPITPFADIPGFGAPTPVSTVTSPATVSPADAALRIDAMGGHADA
ncbi:MAG: hypothetical protein M3Q71_23850 [Chloroflexota bacterium]|nr:hypothetical protein [Chloroflexota bacterium]